MRALLGLLAAASIALPAHADGISKPHQDFLEGIWSGVSTEVNADKLCSTTNPPNDAVTMTIEFLRSGGVAYLDDGTEAASRNPIKSASEANGIVSLTIGEEVWRFRFEGDRVMYRVRSSASLGGDVDTMVFKRCKKAADRSTIALDDNALKLLAADLPGDEAYFIDERLVAKTGDRCAVEETQYVFFALIGPSEFRVSRWNSFALADKLAAKKPVKLPPLDPVGDWQIETVRTEGGKFVVRMKEFDNAKAVPQTIHIEPKADGITIPEWHHTFVRCKGFQSRS